MSTMETKEIQEMKEQMALLKESLRQEQIVNDRLLREAMHGKVKRIHRKAWVTGICALYVCTFGCWSFYEIGLSWYFIGATVAMMIYSVLKTIVIHRRLAVNNVMTDDLRTVAHAAKRLKQDYIRALYGGMVMVFIWFLWLAAEILFGHTVYAESSLMARSAVLGMLFFGGVIGFILGYRIHRRVLSLCDEIIRQVDEEV